MLAGKGYEVIPGPYRAAKLAEAVAAIEGAVADAAAHEVKVASSGSNVRVAGLLDRAPMAAALFTHRPLLLAASQVIAGPFRLSGFHVRTVLPGAPAQALHQDVAPHRDGWPLVGFIFMLDPFTRENGATRFVPSSENRTSLPSELLTDHPAEECACGPAGSMILFNGSVWHGFGANSSAKPRRSVYGALIPSGATAARDYERSLPADVWSNLPPLARNVLAGNELL